MIDILLVDDEPMVSEILTKKVNWSKYDMNYIGTASNGIEGLKILSQKNVNVVFSDIKMPRMDGNEFIERAYKIYPDIKYVVLSSYADFPIVKKAFKSGACDYLLKEDIGSKDFYALLSKIKNEFKKTDSIKMRDNEESLKEYILSNINTQNMFSDNLSVTVMIIITTNKNCNIFNVNAQSIFNNILSRNEVIMKFKNLNRWIVVMKTKNFKSQEDENEYYYKTADSLLSYINNKYNIDASIGLSKPGVFKTIQSMYKETLKAAESAFFNGFNKIFYEMTINEKVPAFDIRSMKKKLLDAIVIEDFGQIISIIEEGFFNESNKYSITKEILMDNLIVIYNYIQSFFYEDETKILLTPNLKEKAESFDVLYELKTWFLNNLHAYINTINKKQNRNIVEIVKKTVELEYSSSLSLSNIAERLNISECNLSRLFLKEIGLNFSDYLIKIRLQAAQNYLHDTKLKIYEISERVGYTNTEHFSRIFKKYIGMSPAEFREKLQLQ